MLTIASGSGSWRSEPGLAHLAGGHDLARLCADPFAPGRRWILHTTDEDVTEFADQEYDAAAPRHVVALRTPRGKLALYSNWRPGSIEPEAGEHESEFYDYSTEQGRLELSDQQRAPSALEEGMWKTLEGEAAAALRAPLPPALEAARGAVLARYLTQELREDAKAEEAHVRRIEESAGTETL
jgi:hypothetical protein